LYVNFNGVTRVLNDAGAVRGAIVGGSGVTKPPAGRGAARSIREAVYISLFASSFKSGLEVVSFTAFAMPYALGSTSFRQRVDFKLVVPEPTFALALVTAVTPRSTSSDSVVIPY
jgi:hypothetical protein